MGPVGLLKQLCGTLQRLSLARLFKAFIGVLFLPLNRGLCLDSSLLLGVVQAQDSYLVDSASSHMLVSKIKPCMSKYKQSIR